MSAASTLHSFQLRKINNYINTLLSQTLKAKYDIVPIRLCPKYLYSGNLLVALLFAQLYHCQVDSGSIENGMISFKK